MSGGQKSHNGSSTKAEPGETDGGDQGTQGHGPAAALYGQQWRSGRGERSKHYKLPSGAQDPLPDLHIIQPLCPVARAGFWLRLSSSYLKAGPELEWGKGGPMGNGWMDGWVDEKGQR